MLFIFSLSPLPLCRPFQVNASDRLSDRICHACISYLNSWTSFKGRCAAAQRQQKSWLAGQLKKQLLGNGGDAEVAAAVVADEEKPMEFEEDTESYNYYPQYHNKKVSENYFHLLVTRILSNQVGFCFSVPLHTTPVKMTRTVDR